MARYVRSQPAHDPLFDDIVGNASGLQVKCSLSSGVKAVSYDKIGTIQRRLAWPLRKDDTQRITFLSTSSDSLVVMTSALHAEGREFNPRSEQLFAPFVKMLPEAGFEPAAFSLGGRRAIHCATRTLTQTLRKNYKLRGSNPCLFRDWRLKPAP